MEEGHHSTPVDAIHKDAPGHHHEDFLCTVSLNLINKSGKKKEKVWGLYWFTSRFSFHCLPNLSIYQFFTMICRQRWLYVWRSYLWNSTLLFSSSDILSNWTTTSLSCWSSCSPECPPRSSAETCTLGSSVVIRSITYLWQLRVFMTKYNKHSRLLFCCHF